MSENKLLSCPFCGGEAETVKNPENRWYVWCKKCWCKTTTNTSEKFAIIRWNTRKPMERIVERLEGLQVEYMYPDDDDYIVGQYDGVREALTVVLEEGGLNG